MSLAKRIEKELNSVEGAFSMNLLYSLFPDEKQSTIRGRVYEQLLKRGKVHRVSHDLYIFKNSNNDAQGAILNGDARNLDFLKKESVDLIIADHPYHVATGTNKSLTKGYEETIFEYTKEDFEHKARVLKKGGFLIEFLPEMKDNNIEYIMSVVQMARSSGLELYSKVTWAKMLETEKGIKDYSPNLGRKKVCEDIWIFTKGTARKLRNRNQGGKMRLESGAKEILPAIFMEAPIDYKIRVHQAEKPASLLKKIINLFSNELDVVLDQFAGSFTAFWSALELNRHALAIEINPEFVKKNALDRIEE